MKINTERLSELIAKGVSDIEKGYCKSEIVIANIRGTLITLSAYDPQEALDADLEDPVDEAICIEEDGA